MKGNQKDSGEKVIWDQMRSSSGTTLPGPGSQSPRATAKHLVWLILFVYTLKPSRAPCSFVDDLFSTPHDLTSTTTSLLTNNNVTEDTSTAFVDRTAQILRLKSEPELEQTDVKHIVFGIAASAKLWAKSLLFTQVHIHPGDPTADMQGWAIQRFACRGCVWLDEEFADPTADTTQVYIHLGG